MKGYKAFNSDLTCRGFQFEIGKTYRHEGEIEPCKSGFHFCKSIADCYKFYSMSDTTRICEIEATGEIKTDDNVKYVTDEIVIIAEITEEWKRRGNSTSNNSGNGNSGNWNSGNGNSGNRNSGNRNSGYWNSGNRNSGYWNSGNGNSGNRNSGDWNSGYWNSGYWNSGNGNSGDWNSGYWNSGDRNSGYWNSGYWNSGDWNSGNRNSGNRNSGNRNSGNWNSGDWNATNFSSGCFCTKEPEMLLFDKPSGMTLRYFKTTNAYCILRNIPTEYVDTDWDDENGSLKIVKHEADRQKWYDELKDDQKDTIKAMPNFDAEKFYKCTGIRV